MSLTQAGERPDVHRRRFWLRGIRKGRRTLAKTRTAPRKEKIQAKGSPSHALVMLRARYDPNRTMDY